VRAFTSRSPAVQAARLHSRVRRAAGRLRRGRRHLCAIHRRGQSPHCPHWAGGHRSVAAPAACPASAPRRCCAGDDADAGPLPGRACTSAGAFASMLNSISAVISRQVPPPLARPRGQPAVPAASTRPACTLLSSARRSSGDLSERALSAHVAFRVCLGTDLRVSSLGSSTSCTSSSASLSIRALPPKIRRTASSTVRPPRSSDPALAIARTVGSHHPSDHHLHTSSVRAMTWQIASSSSSWSSSRAIGSDSPPSSTSSHTTTKRGPRMDTW
jgi:hypothetical protein